MVVLSRPAVLSRAHALAPDRESCGVARRYHLWWRFGQRHAIVGSGERATVPASQPGYDVFCTGHVFLADGRLFVVGGIFRRGWLPNASTSDAVNNLWTSAAPMSAGRW